MDPIARYEGSDQHVYLIEFLEGRYTARTFGGDVYVTGKLPGHPAPALSREQTARATAIAAVEKKIRRARLARHARPR